MLLLAAGTAIPTAQTQAGTILVLGDSISAAYGMDLERGWVALLQQQLSEQLRNGVSSSDLPVPSV